MPAESDEALCIRHWEWSETSQTVALFTRDHGVVRALAKGSRRPKAPFSGGIELLTTAEVGLIIRPNSDLALLTYWDLHLLFPALRSVLAAHHAGMYLAELLLQFVRDHDPHPGLFDAAVTALATMESAEHVPAALVRFQWAVLAECGFQPELNADVGTGEELVEQPDYLFDASSGGLRAVAADSAGAGWRVRAETIAALRNVAGSRLALTSDSAVLERANRLLASYARYVLGYQTPAMQAMFGDRLAQ